MNAFEKLVNAVVNGVNIKKVQNGALTTCTEDNGKVTYSFDSSKVDWKDKGWKTPDHLNNLMLSVQRAITHITGSAGGGFEVDKKDGNLEMKATLSPGQDEKLHAEIDKIMKAAHREQLSMLSLPELCEKLVDRVVNAGGRNPKVDMSKFTKIESATDKVIVTIETEGVKIAAPKVKEKASAEYNWIHGDAPSTLQQLRAAFNSTFAKVSSIGNHHVQGKFDGDQEEVKKNLVEYIVDPSAYKLAKSKAAAKKEVQI